MARFRVYTTFAEGELDGELKKLAQKSGDGSDAALRRSQRLQSKQHECAVTYPDGSAGTCHYTREGPRCHTFRYELGEPNEYGNREYVTRLYHLETLGRDTGSVEDAAQGKALEA
ncbi:MAG: hypothetical protein QM758_13090 [Armatimonas sp.]